MFDKHLEEFDSNKEMARLLLIYQSYQPGNEPVAHQIGCANKKSVGRVWGEILISCMKDHNPNCDFLVLEKLCVFFMIGGF